MDKIAKPVGFDKLSYKKISDLRKELPYFDEHKILESELKYVAWVDIMGAKSLLDVSSRKATIHIAKIHIAALEARSVTGFKGRIYSLVDGVYITSEDKNELQSFLKALMRYLMNTFLLASNENKFLIRGAISFGKTIEGEELVNASTSFSDAFSSNYIRHLVVGTPLARAYNSERKSSAYGIWIDDNARHFSSDTHSLPFTFWKWWKFNTNIPAIDDDIPLLVEALKIQIVEYFEWCEKRSEELLYPSEGLKRHLNTAKQYFEI